MCDGTNIVITACRVAFDRPPLISLSSAATASLAHLHRLFGQPDANQQTAPTGAASSCVSSHIHMVGHETQSRSRNSVRQDRKISVWFSGFRAAEMVAEAAEDRVSDSQTSQTGPCGIRNPKKLKFRFFWGQYRACSTLKKGLYITDFILTHF